MKNYTINFKGKLFAECNKLTSAHYIVGINLKNELFTVQDFEIIDNKTGKSINIGQ